MMVFILLVSFLPLSWADNVQTVRLCEKGIAKAYISPRGTVLDFPTEPEKVVLGTKNSFSIEYIRSDLAISPSTYTSRSNLFVYLQGRRFVLDLIASRTSGVTLYFIKDCPTEQIRPKKNGK